jgi:hypothetical protein
MLSVTMDITEIFFILTGKFLLKKIKALLTRGYSKETAIT